MTSFQNPTPEALRTAILSKVVIVTGAAQGIGFAIARSFATAGARVIIADLDEALGKKAEIVIGHGSLFIKCDVSSWADQARLFGQAMERYNQIDLVVSNAGIDPELMLYHKLNDKSLDSAKRQVAYNFLADEYDEANPELLCCPPNKIFDVNVKGVVYNLKLAVHHMIRGGGGRIVVIGSAASYIPVPDQALYCASKHAVLGLVRATSKRRECLEHGISVTMVAPWLTHTQMTSNMDTQFTEGATVSSASDVAAIVSMIATQPLDTVNGKSFWVQGQTCTEVEDTITECHTKLML